jgi:predicted membrane protein
MKNQHPSTINKSKIINGLLVLLVGLVFFIKQFDVYIPNWLFTWQMLLILIGIIQLFKHNFQKMSGYVLIVIGCALQFHDFYPDYVQLRFFWPLLIMGVGVSMLLKGGFFQFNTKKTTETEKQVDQIQSFALFAGLKKRITSKTIKGGVITSIFGGNEIDFSQADFEDEITLDIQCVFGGVTFIVPSNWEIIYEVNSVFGGLDDQRIPIDLTSETTRKTLRLTGSCVFGGIEVSNHIK